MTTSISKFGKFEPFGLQVAEGAIGYHSVVHVFGYNPDVDSAAEEAIWPAGGLIPFLTLANATVMKVSSTSANDTSAGTGVQKIYLTGINGSGTEVSEIVTMNGQTAVNTVNSYVFIQRITLYTTGSGFTNAGDVYVGTGTVTAGVPAVIYGIMSAGEGNSVTGAWTCPVGYTAYVIQGSMTGGVATGAHSITGRLKVRHDDGLIRTAAITSFGGIQVSYPFDYAVQITAGETVYATAKPSVDNEVISCYFQIVVVQNS